MISAGAPFFGVGPVLVPRFGDAHGAPAPLGAALPAGRSSTEDRRPAPLRAGRPPPRKACALASVPAAGAATRAPRPPRRPPALRRRRVARSRSRRPPG